MELNINFHAQCDAQASVTSIVEDTKRVAASGFRKKRQRTLNQSNYKN
jgi:hypothetical protein